MKQIVFGLFFLICFIPQVGRAGEVTVKSLCQLLLAPPSSSDTPNPVDQLSYGQLIKYMLNRGEAVDLGVLNQKRIVEWDDPSLPPGTSEQATNGRRVVIFSLGKKWQADKRDSETIKEVLDDGYWAAVKLDRDMGGLKKERTVESCVARAEQFGVTDDTLARSEKLIDAANEVRQEQLERSSFEIARDSQHLYEQAEVVPVDSFEEISEYLKTVRNDTQELDLLLILHGSQEGLLLDASGSIVPRPFFKNMSQGLPHPLKIKSIAVFSCFPEQVAKFYGSAFEQLNAAGTQLFFPIDKVHFGEQNTVPLGSLDVFMEKHARALSAPPAE